MPDEGAEMMRLLRRGEIAAHEGEAPKEEPPSECASALLADIVVKMENGEQISEPETERAAAMWADGRWQKRTRCQAWSCRQRVSGGRS